MPGPSWFRTHADAVAEAQFRAAITRLRYRVTYDPANRWWQLHETTQPIPTRD